MLLLVLVLVLGPIKGVAEIQQALARSGAGGGAIGGVVIVGGEGGRRRQERRGGVAGALMVGQEAQTHRSGDSRGRSGA